MSKLYMFKLYPCGWGDTPEEAWEAMKENFYIEKELMPKKDAISVIDTEE